MTITEAKKQAAHGLNGNYKKVLECIPLLEAIQSHQIIAELKRTGVSTADRAFLAKYIDSLIDEGFVVKVGADRYRRKSIEPSVRLVTDELPVLPKNDHEQEYCEKTMADLASEVRSISSQFTARLKSIADRIDGVAILIARDKEQESEAAIKLRQLQAILKGL